MWVAVVFLLLNGQVIMQGSTEKTFVSNGLEGGCSAWIQTHVPALEADIKSRGLPLVVQARCDRKL